jgi:hypothetical protein
MVTRDEETIRAQNPREKGMLEDSNYNMKLNIFDFDDTRFSGCPQGKKMQGMHWTVIYLHKLR